MRVWECENCEINCAEMVVCAGWGKLFLMAKILKIFLLQHVFECNYDSCNWVNMCAVVMVSVCLVKEKKKLWLYKDLSAIKEIIQCLTMQNTHFQSF